MGKEIILTVADDGTIEIETRGFKGKSCMKESAFLENALGKNLSTQLTPAYYEHDGSGIEARKKHLNLCG